MDARHVSRSFGLSEVPGATAVLTSMTSSIASTCAITATSTTGIFQLRTVPSVARRCTKSIAFTATHSVREPVDRGSILDEDLPHGR